MAEAKHILAHHGLRLTQSRAEILDIFLENDSALSQREIEDQMQTHCDRVTIYRTLSSFLDRGILHKVLDDSGAMKYARCPDGCEVGVAHQHDHVHFKCNSCEETLCIEEVRLPVLHLPKGYTLEKVNVLMQGLCPKCAAALS